MDRVQVIKQESTALGGDDADAVDFGSTPIEPQEDAIEAAGLYVQHAATRDETVLISRDADGNLLARDANLGYDQKLVDFLLNNDPCAESGTVDVAYTVTYSGNTVTKEEWKRDDTTLIKSIDYTYVSNKLDNEVRKVFAPDGTTIVAQVTWNYVYAGNSIASANMVRDV